MTDRIFIEGLTAFAQIGIYEWEQQMKQRLVFDLEMAWDCREAARSKEIRHALNYAEVSRFVLDYAQSQGFLLLETLAEELAAELQNRFAIPWLRLKISKPKAVAEAQNVGIVIERGKL